MNAGLSSPSPQVLYLTLASCAIIVSIVYPLVYKSNVVSPSWEAGAGVLIYGPGGGRNPVQFDIVLKQIAPGGGRQRARRYLTHPAGAHSQLCALPGLSHLHALLFTH